MKTGKRNRIIWLALNSCLVLSVLLIGSVAALTAEVIRISHRLPAYKTLTIFVSGEIIDHKKLEEEMLNTYKEKELKSFTSYTSDPSDPNYYTRLSVLGYNSSDILIIPTSKIDSDVSSFAINIDENLANSYQKFLSITIL